MEGGTNQWFICLGLRNTGCVFLGCGQVHWSAEHVFAVQVTECKGGPHVRHHEGVTVPTFYI